MPTLTLPTELTVDPPQTASFLPERCLRRRLSKCECIICLDSCPADALSINSNQVHFEADKFTGCMVCSISCPNDAFEIEGLDLETGLQSLSLQEVAVVSCPRQSQIHHEEYVIPCVGGLSLKHLLTIGIKHSGKIIFNTSACGSCENQAAADHFRSLVTILQNSMTGKLKTKFAARCYNEAGLSVDMKEPENHVAIEL